MSVSAAEFLDIFYRKLEDLGIPYVIIHSYRNLTEDLSGDIDYAVPDEHLAGMTAIQEDLGRQHNWAVVQSFQHGVFACYNVLVSLEDHTQRLLLDACSNYARARRLLVPIEVLLDGRRRYGSYWIPRPAAEFIYEATKLFDAKKKDPAKYLPKLRNLWEQDKEAAESLFTRAFGNTGRSLEDWLSQPAEEWHGLRALMLARNRFGPWLMLRECVRVLKRVLHPTGMQVTILGADASGNSALIDLMQENLGDFFRRSQVFRFQPIRLGSRSDSNDDTDPHSQPPYGLARSAARISHCFLDHWAKYLLKTIRLKLESTLIIFDRDFDDILMNPKRHRLCPASVPLALVLRKVLPKSEVTFCLDADPSGCHARNPEIPLGERERQHKTLRALTADDSRCRLIDSNRPVSDMANSVCGCIIERLLQRRRNDQ